MWWMGSVLSLPLQKFFKINLAPRILVRIFTSMKVMLENMVGQIASVNQSPTLSAKLISVGNKCVWEVAPSRYGNKNNNRVGERFELPGSVSLNCFFGV